MKKALHQPKPKHVLSVLRKVIGTSLNESKEVLGLAPDTVKSIQSGRLRFSEKAAATVAKKTGVAVSWLMQGDGSKAPVTAAGSRFTGETFNRYEMERDNFDRAMPAVRQKGNESFRYYLLLCIKLGRVMLAAAEARDGKFAAWKLRDELNKVGRNYAAFESKDALNVFEFELQHLLNTGTLPGTLWERMLERFHKELCAIENKQASAAVGKPKVKLAKPLGR